MTGRRRTNKRKKTKRRLTAAERVSRSGSAGRRIPDDDNATDGSVYG